MRVVPVVILAAEKIANLVLSALFLTNATLSAKGLPPAPDTTVLTKLPPASLVSADPPGVVPSATKEFKAVACAVVKLAEKLSICII